MKNKMTGIAMLMVIFVFAVSFAFAKHHTPEERGKAHFNNPAFAGGSRPCSACHPNGSGLEGAGAKSEFMGGTQPTLEGAINLCIVNANKGNALDVNSAEMQEIESYIRSLGAARDSGSGK